MSVPDEGTGADDADDTMTTFTVTIRDSQGQPTSRKLADAEIRFKGGEFDDLELSGFAVWVDRNGTGEIVTFSTRQFCVRRMSRGFSLLRWIAGREAQDRLANVVNRAYRRHRNGTAR